MTTSNNATLVVYAYPTVSSSFGNGVAIITPVTTNMTKSTNNAITTTTITSAQQLQECQKLGIKPEKCSDDTILSKHCLSPNCGIEGRLPKLELPIYEIMIGCGIALAVGIITVRRLQKVGEVNIQKYRQE